jgi:cell division septum initiation protein DivIVA
MELVAVSGTAEPAEDPQTGEWPAAVVPGGLDGLLSTAPCFRPSLRGYDRLQVDNYVGWAETELAVARRQIDDLLARLGACATELESARRAAADRDRSGMPAPIADLLRRAAEEARQVSDVAVREARRMTEAAAEQARRTVAVANDEARRTTEAADAEAMRILAEARLEADARLSKADAIIEAATAAATERLAAAEREVEEVRRQRDEARASLRALTARIGEALQGVVLVGNTVVDDGYLRADRPQPVA